MQPYEYSPQVQVNKESRTLIEVNSGKGELFLSMQTPMFHPQSSKRVFVESKKLCQRIYSNLYPDYYMEPEDPQDNHACIFYSRSNGKVNSMMRVCFDSKFGLPVQQSLESEISALRNCGLVLAEPGRFVIDGVDNLYSKYMKAIYQVAMLAGVDAFLLQVRNEHADFYRRCCGASTLNSSKAPEGCTNLCWSIPGTHSRFFRAFGKDQSDLESFLAMEAYMTEEAHA